MPLDHDQFKVEINRDKILKIFSDIQSRQEVILIWQRDMNNIRMKHNATIFSLVSGKDISLKIKGSRAIRILSKLTIYFRGVHRSLLFKASLISIQGDIVKISFPKEVRILERRIHYRITFGVSSKNCVSFRCSRSKKEFFIRVFDYSERGIALLVNQETRTLLAYESDIYLTKINGVRLTNEIKGRIKHIRQFLANKNIATDLSVKVGIELENSFEVDDLVNFIL